MKLILIGFYLTLALIFFRLIVSLLFVTVGIVVWAFTELIKLLKGER